MANKWAIQNGNWSDGSTWNDGVVPTADDDVWLNGKTVNYIDEIVVKSISNTKNESLEISVGGSISLLGQTRMTISADIFCDGNGMLVHNGIPNRTTTINGNIIANATLLNSGSHHGCNVVINGNVINNSEKMISNGVAAGSFLLNGNISSNITGNHYIFNSASSPIAFTFNGNIEDVLLGSGTATTVVISGNITIRNGIIYATNLQIVGNVYYSDANWVSGGISFTNLSGEIREWKNITQDSTAPIERITKYQLNNRQQYPQESDVKNGVEYAYGLKEGNYTPNFPQESTVLKDVEYGDDKVGTLEVIALSGATATAENISVVNLTEQEVNRVKNCATVSTVQKCFEDFKEDR